MKAPLGCCLLFPGFSRLLRPREEVCDQLLIPVILPGLDATSFHIDPSKLDLYVCLFIAVVPGALMTRPVDFLLPAYITRGQTWSAIDCRSVLRKRKGVLGAWMPGALAEGAHGREELTLMSLGHARRRAWGGIGTAW